MNQTWTINDKVGVALVCRDALIILKQTINYTDEYCKIVLIHSKLVPMHILCC